MEPPAEGCPIREKSRRIRGATSTAVPTVERAGAHGPLVYDDGGRVVPDFPDARPLVVRHLVTQEHRIAALPLAGRLHGDSAESQGTLAASGHTGEYHQLAFGNGHINVLEIVLVCVENLDIVLSEFFHGAKVKGIMVPVK